MAVNKNIIVDQGSTFIEKWNILNEGNPTDTPLDLTGYSARMQVRNREDDITPVLSFTSTSASPELVFTAPASQGQVVLTIPDSTTSSLSFRGDIMSGIYDLEIVSPAGIVTRITEGGFILNKEITR